MNSIKCDFCHLFKEEHLFSQSQLKRSHIKCKDCIKKYNYEYNRKNSEKISIYNKKYKTKHKEEIALKKKIYDIEYKEKNKEKAKIQNKKYYEENINKIREKQNLYEKEKMKSDIFFRLRKNISKTISLYLKKNKSSKQNRSILNYLSYTMKELKMHIELHFEQWMTWNNYGGYNSKTWDDNNPSTWTWNIDHIIPQSDLPYKSMEDENFKKCWALENLRPLSAKQNFLDGVNRTRHNKDKLCL